MKMESAVWYWRAAADAVLDQFGGVLSSDARLAEKVHARLMSYFQGHV